VLRASFWLAPCLLSTTRPCDPTVGKTRDASDRLLPPVRTACTRTSRVPGSLPPLSERGRLTESGLCAACPGNRVFHTTRNASADRAPTRFSIASRPFRCRRGSQAWALSSHGAGSTEPLTSLSPLPLPVRTHALSRVLVIVSRGLRSVFAEEDCRADRIGERAAKAAVTIAP